MLALISTGRRVPILPRGKITCPVLVCYTRLSSVRVANTRPLGIRDGHTRTKCISIRDWRTRNHSRRARVRRRTPRMRPVRGLMYCCCTEVLVVFVPKRSLSLLHTRLRAFGDITDSLSMDRGHRVTAISTISQLLDSRSLKVRSVPFIRKITKYTPEFCTKFRFTVSCIWPTLKTVSILSATDHPSDRAGRTCSSGPVTLD